VANARVMFVPHDRALLEERHTVAVMKRHLPNAARKRLNSMVSSSPTYKRYFCSTNV